MKTNPPWWIRNSRHLLTSWFALVLLGLAGCGGGPHPVKFHAEMVQSNKRLARASWEFRESFNPLNRGEKIDPDKVQSTYDNLLKTVKDVQEERKKADVHRSSSGEDLHKAYDVFLAGQRRLVEQELGSVVVIAKRVGVPPQNRMEEINKHLSAVTEKENKDLEKLQQAENKFADDQSIRRLQN